MKTRNRLLDTLLNRKQSSSCPEETAGKGGRTKDRNIDGNWARKKGPRKRLPVRDMQLGLDFGTAWSKLVLRDLSRPGGERWCMVVRPEEGEEDYRFPSLVTLHDGRLWFGPEAAARKKLNDARCFASVKMMAAFPDKFYGPRFDLPADLSPKDLAVLEVLYLLQEGLKAAETYTRTKKSTPRMGFSLGVPMAYLDREGPRELFHEIAITAFELLNDRAPALRQGPSLEEAVALIERSRTLVPEREDWGAPEDWLRPEATSALMWVFNSPEIGPGLYSAIDVGAGTTSASFFSILEENIPGSKVRRKSKIVFFGAATAPPGLDKLDQKLTEIAEVEHQLDARGREADILNAHFPDQEFPFGEVLDEYYDVYRQAWKSAYLKDPRQSQWENYGLVVLGGGSKVPAIRNRLKRSLVPNFSFDIRELNLGRPADLHELDGSPFHGDHHLLLVAYGLSFPQLEIPEFDKPSEVPTLKLELKLGNRCVYCEPYE